MNKIEQQIITNITSGNLKHNYKVVHKFHKLLSKQFQLSDDFILEFIKIDTFNSMNFNDKNYLLMLKDILMYCHKKDKIQSSTQDHLDKIRDQLISLTHHSQLPLRQGLLDEYFANGILMVYIYIHGGQDLIDLFTQHLPPPPIHLFPKGKTPAILQEKVIAAEKSIGSFVAHNQDDIDKVENAALVIQRFYRKHQRKEEFQSVIDYQYKSTKTAADLAEETLAPYTPQCTEELASRLLDAAKRVPSYKTIRHLTASSSLASILDNGVLGRRNLEHFYHPYRAAALMRGDQYNGDANVVCFSARDIDPICMKPNTVEITYDLEALKALPPHQQPCMFFKQKDLGFANSTVHRTPIWRSIPLLLSDDEESYSFSHTHLKKKRIPKDFHVEMLLTENPPSTHYDFFSEVPNFYMISSNIDNMMTILTMNFFRFLDNCRVYDRHGTAANEFITDFYNALDALTDDQLVEKLTEIAQQCSDTMEFNFYGSFLMDPQHIQTINVYEKRNTITYSITIKDFIAELQQGNIGLIDEVAAKLPSLFQSYRFIDYLLKQDLPKDVYQALLQKRVMLTTIPPWRPHPNNPIATTEAEVKSKEVNPIRSPEPKTSIRASTAHIDVKKLRHTFEQTTLAN